MTEINCKVSNSFENNNNENNLENYTKKLTITFSKLLEDSLVISDDTMMEKLFTHLAHKIKTDGWTKKNFTVYVSWLRLVMKQWETIQLSTQAFAVRLAGIISSRPAGFFLLEEEQVMALIAIRVQQQSQVHPSMMLAVINFITSAVTHQVGCNWVMQTEIWRIAVKCCHMDTSIYTSKASATFITNLILLLEQNDKSASHSVIDAVVKPLSIFKRKDPIPTRSEMLESLQFYMNPDGVPLDNGVLSRKQRNETMTTEQTKTLKGSEIPRRILLATIKFLNEVLDALLKSRISVERVNYIFKDYCLEMWAWEQLFIEDHDFELLRSLSSMLTLLNFLGTEVSPVGEIAYNDIELLNLAVLRLAETLMYKRQYSLMFDICSHSQKLRHIIIKKVVFKDTNREEFDLGNQLIILQSLPLFVFARDTTVPTDNMADKYRDKMLAMSHKEARRVYHQFRDMFRHNADVNVKILSQQAVISIMKTIGFVNREQAVTIFQTMMYFLRQFVHDEASFDRLSLVAYDTQRLLDKYPHLLMSILECISVLISKFDITWNENMEAICLLTFCQALISNANITTRMCVQTLKLIQLAIENFILPNQTSQIVTLETLNIDKLGAILMTNLSNPHWEVRDSALEVLQTIGKLSDVKFPAFQTLLLEPNLLYAMVKLVLNDLESYVRGTAMICLCDLVKVQNLWDKKLSRMCLPTIAVDFVKSDTEGPVRKAACQLLTAIYKHQTVSPTIVKGFHHRMYHAAVKDLHWEVRIAALDFWQAVLEDELKNEDIVTIFPESSCSKHPYENTHINKQEIQKKFRKVLDNLSKNGCLQVLWVNLHDECDLLVVQSAAQIIHKLMNLLTLYFNCEAAGTHRSQALICDIFGVEDSFNLDNCSDGRMHEDDVQMPDESSQQTHVTTDMINQIIDNHDTDLLSSVKKLDSYKEPIDAVTNQDILITAKNFLENISKVNINEIVDSKRRWLEETSDNLESLLDDILSVNDSPDHINNIGLDCY